MKINRPKAVVLLSGGLDSAVTLYIAKSKGYDCSCLIFNYGQRHKKEVNCALRVARKAGCNYKILRINLPWKGSVLLEKNKRLPVAIFKASAGIPSTYVPARNIIFLSFALSFAEAIRAEAIFIGAHSHDYSGYPDCRPEFIKAFRSVILKGTKTGAKGKRIALNAPLINKSKAEIVRIGARLRVPFGLTWSCYAGGRKPCGKCDSCYYRRLGFQKAGIKDL